MRVRMSADPPQQTQRTYPIQGKVPQQQTSATINVAAVAEKTDLVTLAWEYGLDLFPQNNGDYVCLCPFHADSETPSMRFYVETNTFHCFGCHAGASVFEFVMRMENMTFPDALHRLAERAGYSNAHTLRDLNIISSEDSFTVVREKIETELHRKAYQVYIYLKNIGIPPIILGQYFDALWQWYDHTQYIFDKKLFDGFSSLLLQQKLYTLHQVFLSKLSETENVCLSQ